METWKSIVGYDDYIVSNNGIVKSLKYGKERVLKQDTNIDGYFTVALSKDNKKKKFRVHRLVAELFIPNPNSLPIVNHKDGDKQNNNAENLEWCTHTDNMRHAHSNGLINIENCRESKRNKMKPVLQIDKNTGEVIRRFESYRQVVRELNINKGNLNTALNNEGRTCSGFIWRYDE